MNLYKAKKRLALKSKQLQKFIEVDATYFDTSRGHWKVIMQSITKPVTMPAMIENTTDFYQED